MNRASAGDERKDRGVGAVIGFDALAHAHLFVMNQERKAEGGAKG